MKKIHLIIAAFFLAGNLFAVETWDLIDKSMSAWNVNGGIATNKAWTLTFSNSGSKKHSVTQEASYVNISKTYTYHSFNYAFLTPSPLTLQSNTAYTFEVKARMKPIDKVAFPDITPPLQSEGLEGGFESNQISARLNAKNMAIHVKYGGAGEGYVTVAPGVDPAVEERYVLNTSEWHTYRFVFHADNLRYDVYIDNMDEPVFENIATGSLTGTNILRLGAETNHRCNMDVEYVKMGTGDFSSKPKIRSVNVASDSHVFNNERTVSVTVNTVLINNGEKLSLLVANEGGIEVIAPAEITVTDNNAVSNLTFPASLPMGKYTIKAFVSTGMIGEVAIAPKTAQYRVVDVSPIDTKMLPQVKPVAFVIEMDNYLYKGPSNEFIFPSIIDAKKFTANGKFVNGQDTLARYYRYYTPHENPGGMYLATGPTLDGPWTERNTVIDLTWAKSISDNVINKADHISACQVVWNDIYNKFFMYFHGPNTTTHYAVSDNLVDWTFAGNLVNCKQFSSKGTEASYAKIFEHTIPGLNNKYVMLLMIMEEIRRIYWAYSDDGVNWTPVKKPLVSPDLNYKKVPGTDVKPNYVGGIGNNVSGPFLFEKDGRCFVFCNGSSGNMFIVEVGESFDMEIHWGEYLKASDIVIDTDNLGFPIAVPRIAAPVFIQNDNGKWYMFFEAGSRLGANIAYAKEEDKNSTSTPALNNAQSPILVYPTLLEAGKQFTVQAQQSEDLSVEVVDMLGHRISSVKIDASSGKIQAPDVPGIYFVKVKAKESLLGISKIIVR